MKKKLIATLIISIFVLSCQKETEKLVPLALKSQEIVDSLTQFSVDVNLAEQTSRYFWDSKVEDSKNARVSAKEIEKVVEYKNEEKNTVCFIVNYKDGKGYTIVSADRRMIPVLAYSEDENFDDKTENMGIQYWLGIIKDVHKNSQKIKKVADDVEKMWRKYDKQSAKNKRIGSAEDCGPLPNNILIPHLTDGISIWGQGSGYNYYCPNRSGSSCNCGKAAAGCGPVAMGQVMRYHKKQVSFNNTVFTQATFNSMPRWITTSAISNWCTPDGSNNLSISWLLSSLGQSLNVNYSIATNCQTAVLAPSNIVSLFNQLGYNSFEKSFYSNVGLVDSEILNNRPVILYGSNCNSCIWNAHIWVLDGLQKSYWWDVIPHYDDYGNYWEECRLGTYTTYQMNWGWNGGSNGGWFTLYGFNGAGTIYDNASMKAYIVRP